MVVEEAPTAQRAPAKGRILDTASVLFYEDGIRTVGVDRIIAASSVTKATFYKHYRAKDNLIVEYITGRHRAVRTEVEHIIDAAESPDVALRAIIASIASEIASPGFRGCAFINAAAEFPDAEHPVRQVVTQHREWYVDTLADLLRELGHPVPGDAADELQLARDGALSGGYAGDSIAATAALGRIANRVLAEARPA
ncbi:TetR/AcrR family transcriptional regulator [Salinibacterium soli]|uniref:TetR/AcrR family transcriptional regulator n=1 Tax=Antiquaquibacter soli TaxID=3064523 RepID=A0ABT9BQM6_9MICO|nr:TetR/AcrR family transcriptional regulator [Protaetiibacter sp. WY-16]MDO7881695.1 TetR/AcrR family transcriptional regulator [Protaetiibacter sp. WY-16]